MKTPKLFTTLATTLLLGLTGCAFDPLQEDTSMQDLAPDGLTQAQMLSGATGGGGGGGGGWGDSGGGGAAPPPAEPAPSSGSDDGW